MAELLNRHYLETVERLASEPNHALLLSGLNGYVPTLEASRLAERITGHHGGLVQQLLPEAGKTAIGVDQVRSLYLATRAKQTNGYAVWLVPLENASPAAQNALLKLLEEPPRQTVFIILVSQPEAALQTIRSRCQPVPIWPYEPQQAKDWLKEQGIDSPGEINQLLFVSEGSASELAHLAADAEYRAKQIELAAAAKQLVSARPYEALSQLNPYFSDRAATMRVVHLAIVMLNMLMSRQASADIKRRLGSFIECYERLQQNGNPRAQLLATITA